MATIAPTLAGVRARAGRVDQSVLVLGLVVILVIVGALTTPGFLQAGNFLVVLTFAAAPGVVAMGLAYVVLGKGIDLSVGAVAVVTGQVTLELMTRGWTETAAIVTVVVLTVLFGVLNGVLTAVVGVPALIITLGTGQLLLGVVKIFFLSSNLYALPDDSLISALGGGSFIGIAPAIWCAALVFFLSWLVWSFTAYGRLVRAIGDNIETARLTGAPVRPVQVSTYVVSALLAMFAGYMIVAREGSVTTTGSAFSPLLFTALTAVVIGGVSLSGGRGTVLGVVVGTILIGIITNLLTLNQLSATLQDFVRGFALLVAIVLDAWLHPRDEETSKSGDL